MRGAGWQWLESLGSLGAFPAALTHRGQRVISLPGFYCSGGCDIAKPSPGFTRHKGSATVTGRAGACRGWQLRERRSMGSYSREKQRCTVRVAALSPSHAGGVTP